jgi:hypothetical protein
VYGALLWRPDDCPKDRPIFALPKCWGFMRFSSGLSDNSKTIWECWAFQYCRRPRNHLKNGRSRKLTFSFDSYGVTITNTRYARLMRRFDFFRRLRRIGTAL